MKRRDAALAPLALCGIGVPRPVLAQTSDKVWRIGVLLHEVQLDGSHRVDGGALKELGYVEGRNLQLDVRSSQGRPELGINLKRVPLASLPHVVRGFQEIERDRPDAIAAGMTGVIASNAGRVIQFAARQRLPDFYTTNGPVRNGGLMSYAPSFSVMAKRTAAMIDRIFKGTKPADIPVEEPAQFELVINLKTAKALGITIPQSLLLRADEVVQ